jgi:hypothetical protein
MKSIRRVHGWLGVLFAPAIILFALTGALQMFGLHETERGDTPGFIAKIAMIHTHQTATIPQRAARPPQADAPKADAPKADAPKPPANKPTTLPLKLFFLVMALSLIVSSVLGVWIAFVSKRDRNLHIGLLVAGVVLPIVLLLV